jgi:hypothetical protein
VNADLFVRGDDPALDAVAFPSMPSAAHGVVPVVVFGLDSGSPIGAELAKPLITLDFVSDGRVSKTS